MKAIYRTSARCALALLVCLALSLGSAAAAEAQNGSFWAREDGVETPYAQSMAAIGDTLYLLSQNALYRLLPGDGEPSVFLKDLDTTQWVGEQENQDQLNVSYLFVMNGCLYGFGQRSGTVTRLTDETGALAKEPLCKLDMGAFQSEDIYISQVFYANDKLCMLTEGQGVALYEYALAEGATPVQREATDIICMTSYKDGLLLGVTRPYVDESDPNAHLVSFDPATGTMETLYQTGQSDYAFGVGYDPETDVLYYGMDCRIYGVSAAADQAVATVAYLPERCDGFLWMGSNGTLVARASSGVYLRAVTGADVSQQVLTVAGEYGSSEHMAVVREHPEMVISPNSDYISDLQALTTAMVSGESSMDVLLLDPEYQPVESLINKGYAVDLSAYPEIMAVVQQMDPRFLEPFRRNGGLYAVPVSANAQTVSVDRKVWMEELGLSLDELPKTYMELLDFVANFSYDYGDDHPDIALTDSWDLRSELLSLILQSEAVYQTREDADGLSFDTPRFHKLVDALDSIDYSDISLSEVLGMNASDDDYNEFYSRKQLFSLYYGVSGPGSCSDKHSVIPLVLALDEGLEPVLPASLTVLLMNPKSVHPEMAATYIASYLNHLEPATSNVTLFPEHNDSVPNPGYETWLQEAKDWLAERQKALDNAAPENKASLADEVEQAKTTVAEAENARYLTTAEEIAAYRKLICPYLLPLANSSIIATGGEADTSIRTLLNQYAERAIDANTFIRELNNRIRLKMLENQ